MEHYLTVNGSHDVRGRQNNQFVDRQRATAVYGVESAFLILAQLRRWSFSFYSSMSFYCLSCFMLLLRSLPKL